MWVIKAWWRKRSGLKPIELGGIMAFDEGVAQRLRDVFAGYTEVNEKKMFGGLAFMLSGHMCCGVVGEELMARVGPEQYPQALQHVHARPMDFTGRPLTGFVYVSSQGIETDAELEQWVAQCVRFIRTLPPK